MTFQLGKVRSEETMPAAVNSPWTWESGDQQGIIIEGEFNWRLRIGLSTCWELFLEAAWLDLQLDPVCVS